MCELAHMSDAKCLSLFDKDDPTPSVTSVAALGSR
jgi:hypothetical protein